MSKKKGSTSRPKGNGQTSLDNWFVPLGSSSSADPNKKRTRPASSTTQDHPRKRRRTGSATSDSKKIETIDISSDDDDEARPPPVIHQAVYDNPTSPGSLASGSAAPQHISTHSGAEAIELSSDDSGAEPPPTMANVSNSNVSATPSSSSTSQHASPSVVDSAGVALPHAIASSSNSQGPLAPFGKSRQGNTGNEGIPAEKQYLGKGKENEEPGGLAPGGNTKADASDEEDEDETETGLLDRNRYHFRIHDKARISEITRKRWKIYDLLNDVQAKTGCEFIFYLRSAKRQDIAFCHCSPSEGMAELFRDRFFNARAARIMGFDAKGYIESTSGRYGMDENPFSN